MNRVTLPSPHNSWGWLSHTAVILSEGGSGYLKMDRWMHYFSPCIDANHVNPFDLSFSQLETSCKNDVMFLEQRLALLLHSKEGSKSQGHSVASLQIVSYIAKPHFFLANLNCL